LETLGGLPLLIAEETVITIFPCRGIDGPSRLRVGRRKQSYLIMTLERQSYGEVERKVATEHWMGEGVAVTSMISWMDGFHTGIKAENEEVEVHAKANSVGYSYLAVEVVQSEGSTWLVGIVANRPYIAGIDEEGTVELPEKEGAVFDAEVKLEVTRLVDEVDATISSVVGTWTK